MHVETSPLYNKSIRQNPNEVNTAARELGRAAAASALREIMTAPKPGLVDPLGSGCHTDMDWHTFTKSCEAIAPYWEAQANTGVNGTPPESALAALRAAGVEMERAMFEATGGVNTHKGLIYLMSLLLYGAGRAVFLGKKPNAESAARLAAEAAAGSVERELRPLLERADTAYMTHGEKLYALHSITGVRGEAEAGFPSVLNAGLPELLRAESLGAGDNNAAIASLLAIMEVCEDSNVIHRGGYEFWRGEYHGLVRSAREGFDPVSGGFETIAALEKRFLPLRISPGGAADLLSCTFFLKNISFLLVNIDD